MRAALWPDEDPDELASELEALLADPLRSRLSPSATMLACAASRKPACDATPTATMSPHAPFREGWWVDEDARRSGVGRALVAAVEDWALAQGFTELGSDALLDNTLSHQAHRSIGFEERERVIYFRKWL